MTEVIYKKTKDFYARKPNAPILMHEFGYYCLDRWIGEGHIKDEAELNEICGIEPTGMYYMGRLGWCEAAFVPHFETKVLEDRGKYELVQDYAGRQVLYFKGRRNGFMPEYVGHPVKDRKTWEEDVKWRLNPTSEGRPEPDDSIRWLRERLDKGAMLGQSTIGGYMYLRSLMGPEDTLYMFYDDPDLIHDMMRTWFNLADAVTAAHQKLIAPYTIEDLFFAEDICYKAGPLISPDMMREFLLPYYQQLITNIKNRQGGKGFHIQIDTDGDMRPVIPVYQEIGANYFNPFEVASGLDVVEIRKQYPEMLMRGGIDKRILAEGKEAIDREIDRIMPFMVKHGGYLPQCDHGVPEEVSFENFVHFRKRLKEFA